ncbi:TetR/AcrR family transcriptional regulator [Calidithermus roseus]|uniref:HTH-type transcriptional repressor NicS n=1 Tax=Calidithermus roseus TaxID=1644118 RepID=A0A399EZX5_9DEIN|nr:TetR/AcrR family transcriptional regulator [Calidithermus roseus]RIH89323.1 HTH-type transcriptional repressor NicS [Calidithermus roseus]
MSEPTPTRQERIRQRSAERRERSRQQTRQAILEAATQLFEREGYEGFSLRQVAEAIGYTPTTIYLYFKDKDDLLFAVCSQGFARFTQALQRAYDQHPDPLERLRALAWTYLEFGLSHPLHYQVMFMQRSEWALRASAPAGEVEGSTSYHILLQAVTEAMKAGKIRMGDPLETTNLVWSGMHGIVSLALSMKGVVPRWDNPADVRRLAGQFMEMLARGLSP